MAPAPAACARRVKALPRYVSLLLFLLASLVVSSPSGADGRVVAEEYVVAFDSSPAALHQAVGNTGGEVVDVNEQLAVALVRTADATGLGQQAGVEGVMRNHSVGLERPDQPHRYAE